MSKILNSRYKTKYIQRSSCTIRGPVLISGKCWYAFAGLANLPNPLPSFTLGASFYLMGKSILGASSVEVSGIFRIFAYCSGMSTTETPACNILVDYLTGNTISNEFFIVVNGTISPSFHIYVPHNTFYSIKLLNCYCSSNMIDVEKCLILNSYDSNSQATDQPHGSNVSYASYSTFITS